ncbi:hypothetical protein [Zooshikella harenae]|uniref:Uncharacterized protein n=1 Tax=Zooshikella harenae TaxID=2827238 RepID=A0ABS5ZKI1_9GAMM|nr:hypothetical protein [Zooshikella harenae]MBU2714470.1 hypothetical protein [Zooshikella harenae]
MKNKEVLKAKGLILIRILITLLFFSSAKDQGVRYYYKNIVISALDLLYWTNLALSIFAIIFLNYWLLLGIVTLLYIGVKGLVMLFSELNIESKPSEQS